MDFIYFLLRLFGLYVYIEHNMKPSKIILRNTIIIIENLQKNTTWHILIVDRLIGIFALALQLNYFLFKSTKFNNVNCAMSSSDKARGKNQTSWCDKLQIWQCYSANFKPYIVGNQEWLERNAAIRYKCSLYKGQ